jgi:hypothetical protein
MLGARPLHKLLCSWSSFEPASSISTPLDLRARVRVFDQRLPPSRYDSVWPAAGTLRTRPTVGPRGRRSDEPTDSEGRQTVESRQPDFILVKDVHCGPSLGRTVDFRTSTVKSLSRQVRPTLFPVELADLSPSPAFIRAFHRTCLLRIPLAL